MMNTYIYKTGLLLIITCFIVCGLSYAQDNDSQTISLFAQPKIAEEFIEPEPEELQRMTVQVNEEIFRTDAIKKGDKIRFDLFSERSIEANVIRSGTDVLGTTSINASIPGEVPGTLIITHHDDRFFATVNLYEEDRLFYIKSDPKTGDHFLIEMDKSAMEPFECGGVLMDPETEVDGDLKMELEVID